MPDPLLPLLSMTPTVHPVQLLLFNPMVHPTSLFLPMAMSQPMAHLLSLAILHSQVIFLRPATRHSQPAPAMSRSTATQLLVEPILLLLAQEPPHWVER